MICQSDHETSQHVGLINRLVCFRIGVICDRVCVIAVRAVETNYLRTQAYQAARELAEQKLEGEVEKLKVGMSINYLVLSFQRDLADAQTLELKALTEYRISLANLDKVMGVGREKQNVNVVLESR